jgi:hypothetical protein
MIRKEDGKYCLYSHDGSKKLGEYDTEAEAHERERQIIAAKHAKESLVATLEPEPEMQIREREESGVLLREAEPTGSEWDVRILKFGTSRNGWIWTKAVGESLLAHLRGAKVGLSSDRDGRLGHHPNGARSHVGEIRDPRIEEDGIYGRLLLGDVRWLKESLLGLAHRGRLADSIGLSIDTFARVAQGAAGRVISGIEKLMSVDIVGDPSADGRFIRATAGPLLSHEGGDDMDKEVGTVAVAELNTVREMAKSEVEALRKEAAEFKSLRDQIQSELTKRRVSEALGATKLPEPIKAKVLKAFDGRVAEAPEIADAVKAEVDTWAAIHESGDVKGFGGSIEVTAAPRDKVQAGLDRLFGVDVASFTKVLEATSPFNRETVVRLTEDFKPSYEASKDPGLRFKGLRHFYTEVTGDTDMSGRIPNSRRVGEAVALTVATQWADILGNTLYRRLLMRYAEPQYNERTIAKFGSAPDHRTREVVIMGYFGDLSTVAENAAYTAITDPTDDKVTYAVTKRGNLFGVTREAIIADDLRSVQEAVDRLGRAARRTLAQFIWTFWNGAGSVYDVDTVAWFNAAHANTGTTALTADAAGAAEVFAKVMQLADQTEPGSGKKIGIPPLTSLWLDVPHALYSVARRLNISREFGAGVTNQVFGMFGDPDRPDGGERINVNPLFTDATDWGVHVEPGAGMRESIGVDFLNGREEPEFWLADLPTQGALFTNDRIEYKIRHEYGGDLTDFRGAAKNVVA